MQTLPKHPLPAQEKNGGMQPTSLALILFLIWKQVIQGILCGVTFLLLLRHRKEQPQVNKHKVFR